MTSVTQVGMHAYPSPFTHETRMLKQTRSLAEARLFDRILIAAIWQEGLAEHERLDDVRHVWRMKLYLRSLPGGAFAKALRFLEWQARLTLWARREGVTCVSCHSLSVLPFGALLKWLRQIPLVYETHELETETPMSGFRRKLSKGLERWLFPSTDAVVVVSGLIGEWYRTTYGRNGIAVVRNVPYRPAAPLAPGNSKLRALLQLPEGDFVFLYQGALEEGRGVQTILGAFEQVDESRHVVFMGFGPLSETIRAAATRRRNVHLVPAVPPAEVLAYTSGADVGIHMIDDSCLNHYYCLPNKVFEYAMAGLPIIVSDFPEMRTFVQQFSCGWTTAPTVDRLRDAVTRITRDDVLQLRQGAARVRRECGWHVEEAAYLPVYSRLLGRAPATPTTPSADGRKTL